MHQCFAGLLRGSSRQQFRSWCDCRQVWVWCLAFFLCSECSNAPEGEASNQMRHPCAGIARSGSNQYDQPSASIQHLIGRRPEGKVGGLRIGGWVGFGSPCLPFSSVTDLQANEPQAGLRKCTLLLSPFRGGEEMLVPVRVAWSTKRGGDWLQTIS